MGPAALLEIIVKTQGIGAAASKLASLDAAGAAAAGRLSAVEGRLKSTGKSAIATGGLLTRGVSLPLAGIGVIAGKMGADFQAAMELVHTQSGASQKEVDQLSGKVLDLARHSKQGPVELANALYRIEGAGLRGSAAMNALAAASKIAAVGNTDVESTAKTLSQTWFSGIKGAGGFNRVVAQLNATVGAGDLRMGQLVDALGTGVLPVAHQAGLSLSDITGVMATFGDETNNVSGWTAQFSTALHYLYAPTTQAEKALESIGLTGSRLGQDMRKPQGLLTALTDLRSHLGQLKGGARGLKASQVLADILPGGKGRVLTVLLNQLDRYKGKLKQIAGTSGNFGDAVAKTQETASYRIHAAWASVQTTLTRFGLQILPVVVPVIQSVAGFVGRLGDAFDHLSPTGKRVITIVGLIVIALGPVITIMGVLVAAIGAVVGALSLPVIAVAAVVAALVLLYTHSELVRHVISLIPPVLVTVAQAVVSFGSTVLNAIVTAFNGVVQWVTGAVNTVINEVKQWDWLGHFVKGVFGLIVQEARTFFDLLKLLFHTSMLLLLPILTAAWTTIEGIFSGAWTVLKGIVQGGFDVLRGIVLIIGGLFKGDFHQIWEGVKSIFHGAITALAGILSGAWKILKAPLDGLAAGLQTMFSSTWDGIKTVFRDSINVVIDFLNLLIKALDVIPGVNIKPIGHIGGGGGKGGGGGGGGNSSSGLAHGGSGHQHFARGGAFARTAGLVTSPITLMGEEAPRYPEFVIPTNPAYRGRAHRLVARAAQAVGLATGGWWSEGQLEQLWRRAGGPASAAHTMAIVAEAESGDVHAHKANQYAHNPSGATGLWQILGAVLPGNLYNAYVNARNAVAKYEASGLGPWASSKPTWGPLVAGGGGLGGVLGNVAKGLLGPLVGGFISPSGGLDLSGVLSSLPTPKGLGWLQGVGRFALDKARQFVTSLLGGGAAGPAGGGGTSIFDGKPVANWIIPDLSWARAHGWGGVVTSGFRTAAQQMVAATGYGLGHYGPGGPLGSNHMKTAYPGGAVDVTDAASLAAAMQRFPGPRKLVWGGPVMGDWVHFSATGHRTGGIFGGLPFGGSFDDGGVIPGRRGEPVAIIGHGGETVATPNMETLLAEILRELQSGPALDEKLVERALYRLVGNQFAANYSGRVATPRHKSGVAYD